MAREDEASRIASIMFQHAEYVKAPTLPFTTANPAHTWEIEFETCKTSNEFGSTRNLISSFPVLGQSMTLIETANVDQNDVPTTAIGHGTSTSKPTSRALPPTPGMPVSHEIDRTILTC